MPGAAGSLLHEFEAQWFKPKENVRVEQRSGMNEQNLHGSLRGPTKVSRRDDGTLTIRAPLVKAVAVGFWPDSTEPTKAIRRVMSATPPITTARWVTRLRIPPRKSPVRFDDMWMHHKSACANAEACPLSA